MNPLTVIIPSRTASNLIACAHAVKRNEPAARIICVDDGVEEGEDWDKRTNFRGLVDAFVPGEKPFVFARNCNIGIDAAHRSNGCKDGDVVLLNDDALLETPCGFTALQSAANRDQTLTIVSATTNVANNTAQYPAQRGPRYQADPVRIAPRAPGHHFPAIAFVCVLIPARTIKFVGLLDERYTAYGWEDVDYCRRLFNTGGWIRIHDGCFVDHSKLRSTFRGDPHAPGPIDEGRAIYLDKWRAKA